MGERDRDWLYRAAGHSGGPGSPPPLGPGGLNQSRPGVWGHGSAEWWAGFRRSCECLQGQCLSSCKAQARFTKLPSQP